MKFGYNRPIVSEEKSFEIVDGRMTVRRQTEQQSDQDLQSLLFCQQDYDSLPKQIILTFWVSNCV